MTEQTIVDEHPSLEENLREIIEELRSVTDIPVITMRALSDKLEALLPTALKADAALGALTGLGIKI